MNKNNESLTVKTQHGEIKAVSKHQEDYPGLWLEVNGRTIGLIEFDESLNNHVVRIWNAEDNDADAEYTQIIKRNGPDMDVD